MFCRKHTLRGDRMLPGLAEGSVPCAPACKHLQGWEKNATGSTQLLIRQVTCVTVGTQSYVSKALAYNSIWKKCTREKCQFLTPAKLSLNCTALMERSGAYISLHYYFFSFDNWARLLCFLSRDQRYSLVPPSPPSPTLTHQKDGFLKTPRGRK